MDLKIIILLILVVCLFRESAAGSSGSKSKSRRRNRNTSDSRPIVIQPNEIRIIPDFIQTIQDTYNNASRTNQPIGLAIGPIKMYLQIQNGERFLISSTPFDELAHHGPETLGEQGESSTAAEQHPDQSSGYPFKPIFPRDPMGLEKFVHQNIESTENWTKALENHHMLHLCAKTFMVQLTLLFNKTLHPDESGGIICASEKRDAVKIVYKYLQDVPTNTVDMLHCVCQLPSISDEDIWLPFYLIEIENSESDTHMNFHYIYLDSDATAERTDEKCTIQYGWKVTIPK